jgi:DNA-binding NarL/FixJ family response regulator
MPRPIRVVVIDDHAVLREGLAMVLRHQPDMQLCGQAGDKASAISLIAAERPDVAVIDLALGAEDGLELVSGMRSLCASTRTLVLTQHEEREYVRAAILAGALGYVLKRGSSSNVLDAIRAVAQGKSYLEPSLGEDAWNQILETPPVAQRLAPLTPRERQVFERVARGETHRAIGEQLGIGKKSVDTYRARVYQKLGISSRAELVNIALEAGVLSRTKPPADG